jgi:hypothetical protein
LILKRRCERCGKNFTCRFECGIEGKFMNDGACFCDKCYKILFNFESAKKLKLSEVCESRFGKEAISKKEKIKVLLI